MKILPRFSNEGQLEYPNLHDSLLSMLRCHNKQATLEFVSSEGDVFILLFRGVIEFYSDNFWKKNIVNDVIIESKSEIPMIRFMSAFNSEFIANKERHDEYVKKTLNSVILGEKYFVQVSPSWGCSVSLICDSIEYFKDCTSLA